MTLSAAQRIPAPIGQQLRTNLISSAVTSQDTVRWAGGVSYVPQLHGFPLATDFGTFDPCSPDLTDDVDDSPGTVTATPVGLYVAEKCSTMGGDDAEAVARARQRLTLQQSHLLERAFWTGEAGGAAITDPFTELAAADADVYQPAGTTPVGVVKAFEYIIDAFTDFLGGERGMIHVPAKALPYLAFYGLAFQSGNTIVTSLGSHIIVTGTGYTGTGPDGAAPEGGSVWIYGTSLVEVRLSGIEINTVDSGNVDRSVNDRTVYATQLALAHFDEQAHIGVQVCLTDPGPECAPATS